MGHIIDNALPASETYTQSNFSAAWSNTSITRTHIHTTPKLHDIQNAHVCVSLLSFSAVQIFWCECRQPVLLAGPATIVSPFAISFDLIFSICIYKYDVQGTSTLKNKKFKPVNEFSLIIIKVSLFCQIFCFHSCKMASEKKITIRAIQNPQLIYGISILYKKIK